MNCALGGLALLVLAAGLIAATTAAVLRLRRDSRRGTSGALSSAVLEVESLLDPAKRHAVEAVRSEAGEDDDEGEPPPQPPAKVAG